MSTRAGPSACPTARASGSVIGRCRSAISTGYAKRGSISTTRDWPRARPTWSWAVFAAQQAAEKACTALHMSRGGDAWGHDLTRLLSALPADSRPPADLIDRARALDKHYIPSRDPNGFAAGTPRDHYTRREADTAIADAEAIVEFCARSIPG